MGRPPVFRARVAPVATTRPCPPMSHGFTWWISRPRMLRAQRRRFAWRRPGLSVAEAYPCMRSGHPLDNRSRPIAFRCLSCSRQSWRRYGPPQRRTATPGSGTRGQSPRTGRSPAPRRPVPRGASSAARAHRSILARRRVDGRLSAADRPAPDDPARRPPRGLRRLRGHLSGCILRTTERPLRWRG
jgi:hypothetical protein